MADIDAALEVRRRGRPRSTDKDEAILSAATQLFLSRGFEAASMDAIADAAGVAKVTIYARFPDKDALFRAVLEHKCERIGGEQLLSGALGRTTVDALIEFGRRFVAQITSPDSLAMHRVLMAEGARVPRLPELFMDAAVNQVSGHVAAFLRRETEAGRLSVPPGDEIELAWRFLGAVKGKPHMCALMGLPPLSEAKLSAHVAACAGDLVRAYAPTV